MGPQHRAQDAVRPPGSRLSITLQSGRHRYRATPPGHSRVDSTPRPLETAMTLPTHTPVPLGRHALGSYPRYEQAQRVVDHLSDHGFPVEKVTIVGADLRLVETVTGRLTNAKAAAAGALSTGWLGLLFGLFVGLFSPASTAPLVLGLYGLVLGAVAGAVLGFAAHAATGGRRDFSSRSGLAATRYEVLVEPDATAEAERLVAQLV